MATVLHVVERYLDISAGFVHSAITRSKHEPVVVSRLPIVNEQAFPVPSLRRISSVFDRLPATSLRDRAVRANLLSAAKEVKADIAHAHFGYTLPYATVLASRAGLPLVASLHGHDVTAWPSEAPWAYPNAIDAVDAVVVPSQWLAVRAEALGFPAERIHLIPAGVDTKFFAVEGQVASRIIAFVGRLVEKKGIDVLLAAWPEISETVPDARLLIVGSGPLEPEVRALAEADPNVTHRLPDPARRREQVRDVLDAARVVVTPSRTAADGDSESMLLVNLEAQAVGRPVVTTRHGGITEFVDEDNSALVVPENDAPALTDAIVRVLLDRALARHLSEHGPAVAARFDVRTMTARLDALYDELLARSTK